MPLTASDIVPLTQARANFSELADDVEAGRVRDALSEWSREAAPMPSAKRGGSKR